MTNENEFQMDQEISYHEERALRELNQGFTASSPAAARAHLQLSSLHRERVHALSGRGVSKPPMIMP